MKELDVFCGYRVLHSALGLGKITQVDARAVTVEFREAGTRYLKVREFIRDVYETNGGEVVMKLMENGDSTGTPILHLNSCTASRASHSATSGGANRQESFFKGERVERVGDGLYALGVYYPVYSGLHDDYSRRILALKKGANWALEAFFQALDPLLDRDIALVVVPSHDPANSQPGIQQLAGRLAAAGRVDATSCLERFLKIRELSTGGDRSVDVHLDSVQLSGPHLLKGKRLLILDDITTTGNSFKACRQLIAERAAPAAVACLALGVTRRQPKQIPQDQDDALIF